MTKLQGVIFDMDGLIFDTEMMYYQATQVVADQMGFPYKKETYLDYVGISDEEVWAAYHEMYDDSFGKKQVDLFIQTSFNKVVELFEEGHAELKPGVMELLTYLDKKNIPRILASSNQRRVIDTLLKATDLTAEFPEIVSFDDVVRAKPDPEIFNKAQQRLKVPKENLLIFEDSENGVIAAHRANIPVIMIPDLILPSQELLPKIHQVLPTLAAVPEYLEHSFS